MDPISPISPIAGGQPPLRLEPVAPQVPSGAATGSSQAPGTAGAQFAEKLADALEQVNGTLLGADEAIADLAAGRRTDIQNVMLSAQEASLGLQMTTTVRDRILEAYQEIMRLQI